MKQLLLTIFLFAISTPLFSQATGYLGKRAVFHYDCSLVPSLDKPVVRKDTVALPQSALASSFRHTFEFEWVCGRKHSVGVFYHQFQTGVSQEYNILYKKFSPVAVYDDNVKYYQFVGDTYFKGKLKAHTIGLSWTNYFNGIAPFGSFVRFDLYRINYTFYPTTVTLPENGPIIGIDSYGQFSGGGYSSSDDGMVIYTDNDKTQTGLFIDDRYHTYGASMRVGMQKVYFNRITNRFSIQFGLVYDYYNIKLTDDDTDVNTNVDIDATFTEAVFYASNRRLKYNYLFNVEMGIGVLLF